MLEADVRILFPFDLPYDLDMARVRERGYTPRNVPPATGLEGKVPLLGSAQATGPLTLPDGREVREAWLQPAVFGFGTGVVLLRFSIQAQMQDLAAWAAGAEQVRVAGNGLADACDALAATTIAELAGCAWRSYESRFRGRDLYPVFCLGPEREALPAEEFIAAHRRAILAIAVGEARIDRLSDYALDTARLVNMGYYKDDVVLALDSGAVVRSEEQPVIVDLITLAYAQWWALRAFIHMLNAWQDRAYESLAVARREMRWPFRGRDLAEAQRRLYDAHEEALALDRAVRDITGIPRLFEEWHLEQVYRDLRKVFGLDELYRGADDKVRALRQAFEHIAALATEHRFFVLNIWMFLLFLLEALLFVVWFLSETPH